MWICCDKLRFKVLVFLLAGLMLAPSARVQAASYRIAAVVNNDVITTHDLDEEMNKYSDQMQSIRDPRKREALQKRSRTDLLEEMIKDHLLDQEMKHLGIAVTDVDVRDEMARIAKRNGMTTDQFQKAVAGQGMDLKIYREDLRKHLQLLKFISRKIRPKVSIDDHEVEAYYQAHPQEFVRAGRMHLVQIQVHDKRGGQVADVRKTVRDSRDPVATLRRTKGVTVTDLGTVRPADLNPVFQDAVRSLSEGEVSQELENEKEVVFFKALSREGGEPEALDDVREQIRGMLFEKAIAQQLDLYINNLRRTSHVEVRL